MDSLGIQHFSTPMERMWENIMLEHDHEMETLQTEFLIEAAFGLEDGNGSERNSSTKSNEKENIFSRICKSIQRFIQNAIDMVTNIISKDDLKVSDYMNSDSFQIRLDEDVNAINEIVDQEMLKGRKMVQAIANNTGYPDDMIANYIDKGSASLLRVGPCIIDNALYNNFRKSFNASAQKRKREWEKEVAWMNKGYEKYTPKQKEQMKRVLSHMESLTKKSVSSSMKAIIKGNKHTVSDPSGNPLNSVKDMKGKQRK